MNYWRMQLHPDESDRAAMHTVQSLAAGFIGLGFAKEPGDMKTMSESDPLLEGVSQPERGFAFRMAVGDKVLIMVHNFPFALVTVDGHYNYTPAPDGLGVWFRHFRRVRDVRYYADHVKDPAKWEKIGMPMTIQMLTESETASYRLIQTWG